MCVDRRTYNAMLGDCKCIRLRVYIVVNEMIRRRYILYCLNREYFLSLNEI